MSIPPLAKLRIRSRILLFLIGIKGICNEFISPISVSMIPFGEQTFGFQFIFLAIGWTHFNNEIVPARFLGAGKPHVLRGNREKDLLLLLNKKVLALGIDREFVELTSKIGLLHSSAWLSSSNSARTFLKTGAKCSLNTALRLDHETRSMTTDWSFLVQESLCFSKIG